MAHCNLCDGTIPDVELLEHLRLLHPDDYAEPATWPDGELVIVDLTDPLWNDED